MAGVLLHVGLQWHHAAGLYCWLEILDFGSSLGWTPDWNNIKVTRLCPRANSILNTSFSHSERISFPRRLMPWQNCIPLALLPFQLRPLVLSKVAILYTFSLIVFCYKITSEPSHTGRQTGGVGTLTMIRNQTVSKKVLFPRCALLLSIRRHYSTDIRYNCPIKNLVLFLINSDIVIG